MGRITVEDVLAKVEIWQSSQSQKR
jgi:hypothetical protein